MAPWYLIDDRTPLPAARNMAVDEALFQYCHHSRASFLRLYSWDLPSFSFGASQRAGRAIDRDFISAHGGAWVRRITGGKTVLHHREVTYSVVSSADVFFQDHDLLASYLLISQVLVSALRSLGLPAELSAGSPAELSRSANPCFSFPTRHEIEVAGRKIVGSAQKRDRQALLQHGSIPLAMDYDLYAGGSRFPADRLRQSMVSLGEISTRGDADLRAALIAAFAEFAGTGLVPFSSQDLDPAELAALEAKYGSDRWNFLL